MKKKIDEMRTLMEKLEPNTSKYGLPFAIVKKNLICLTPNSNSLKNLYMLEFHPELACASRLPAAIMHAIEELNHFKNTSSVNEKLNLEINYLTQLFDSLQNLNPPGHSFALNIQKEVFNTSFVDDPLVMSDFIDFSVKQLDETLKNKTKKEQQELILNSISKTLEVYNNFNYFIGCILYFC
jgi:hypothetical protein